jgi:Protein of unknown function (DUF2695)
VVTRNASPKDVTPTMTDLTIDEQAAALLAAASRELTGVRKGECLYCYVARMLVEHGCDTSLRWAKNYRDQQAPRATALESRLGVMGGYCDCEIFLNAMTLSPAVGGPDPEEDDEEDEGEDEEDVALLPEHRPSCRGVRAGSTTSCGIWVRQQRWGW